MAAAAKHCTLHGLTDVEEVHTLRTNLLEWYDDGRRELPWRTLATSEQDPNVRGYAVWVSEIMLQQTQVATVVEYYNRWMKKWPTVEDLAATSLEEVNEMWAGLGYYSRGHRLWDGAKKVVNELGGQLPRTAAELAKHLPGVGRYTANAIASIAFGEGCGVVDGNVVRVLTRLKAIGANTATQQTMDHIWSLAEAAVDPHRPGDFNQALMELGATVCTPKTPLCERCPLNAQCQAHQMVLRHQQKQSLDRYSKKKTRNVHNEVPSLESCLLCLSVDQPWEPSLGVMNYPRKSKKKPPRSEHFAVAVVECEEEEALPQFLLRQRPSTGLLAGLWEFPSVEIQPDWSEQQMWRELQRHLQLPSRTEHTYSGLVVHRFSHTVHHYHSWCVRVGEKVRLSGQGLVRWANQGEILQAAIPTSVRKICKLLDQEKRDGVESKPAHVQKRKAAPSESKSNKKQKTMDAFVTTTTDIQ